LAKPCDATNALLQQFASLLEDSVRTPPDDAGIWLVRPDGYIAAAAHIENWQPVEDCLRRYRR
ncbi:MAG: hypothetical protein KF861_17420, partial [Planctomycetaceae bacterium]|nr:hypothetical protein [Planctomycetaceae bacterium]